MPGKATLGTLKLPTENGLTQSTIRTKTHVNLYENPSCLQKNSNKKNFPQYTITLLKNIHPYFKDILSVAGPAYMGKYMLMYARCWVGDDEGGYRDGVLCSHTTQRPSVLLLAHCTISHIHHTRYMRGRRCALSSRGTSKKLIFFVAESCSSPHSEQAAANLVKNCCDGSR